MAEIKGIERITARILEEAGAYAAAKDAETKEKCESLLSERARMSAQKVKQIAAILPDGKLDATYDDFYSMVASNETWQDTLTD